MNSASSNDGGGEAAASTPPVIINLGKISRKQAKKLRKGEGVYLDEVEPAIARVRAGLGSAAAGKEILPVVVVYQKKPRKSKLPMLNMLR